MKTKNHSPEKNGYYTKNDRFFNYQSTKCL